MKNKNIDTFLNYVSHLDNEIRNLEAEKKLLKQEMFKKHMFDIELGDLIKEYSNLVYEATGISTRTLEVYSKFQFRKDTPENIIKSMILSNSTIVLYFYNQYKCLCHNVEIRLNQMTFPTLKYEDYIDANFLHEAQNIKFKKLEKIKVNFDPNANYMTSEKNSLFAKAIINCAKNKEIQEKIEKTPEK